MDKLDISVAKGDGAPARVTKDYLTMLKDEIKGIAQAAQDNVWGIRKTVEDTRFCRWGGQSTDGLKHQSAIGKPPFPFEGASDSRIRTADGLINLFSAMEVQAATRAAVNVTGVEVNDEAAAGKVSTLLRWIVKNKLGRTWRRELKKVAQWMNGDTPAMAVMGVFWHQEWGLKMTTVTLEGLAERIVETWGPETDPAMIARLADVVLDPMQEATAIDFFRQLLPNLKPARIKSMLEIWREGGAAEFPEVYLQMNQPAVRALRLYDDIFLPPNTTTLARARVIVLREWLSKAEVLEKANSEGWSKSFIDLLIGDGERRKGCEGKSAFPETYQKRIGDDNEVVTIRGEEDYKGLYEIIRPFWKAVNDDGVMAIYTTVLSSFLDETATDRQLIDYAHGEYPFIDYTRETLTNLLMDSRSVADVVQTDQNTQKQHHDAFNDRTSMITVPPIFTPAWAGDDQLVIAPLAQIKRKRRDDYEWMPPPAYTESNDGAAKRIEKRLADYFGLWHPEVSPEQIMIMMQERVDDFLDPTADVLVMMFQLCQQYMTDSEIQRVTGGKGLPVARNVEEIQGKFDLVLDFDVKSLDKVYVTKLLEAVSTWILPIDTEQTIRRDELVRVAVGMVNPNLAERITRPVEEASQSEVDDEDNNFAKIAAGVEPPMKEQGQNYRLRLARLQEIPQANPEALAAMTPASQAIYAKRLEHLQFMVTQEENAMIGRVGAAPALQE